MQSKARGFLAAIAMSFAAGVLSGQPGSRVAWQNVLDQPAGFYATAQARQVAETVLRYQRRSGGWPKDIDMTAPPASDAVSPHEDATIDNGATTTQIRYLARVADAVESGDGADRWRAAAVRGIDYLLAAQYPNGGWPQFFPLRADYSRHITYNDNAMVNTMRLLDDASRGTPPFAFVDPHRRARARAATEKGVAVTLKAQIRVDGTLTVWCAQHDEATLEPRPARSYEHVSLSGSESVEIVRFLMQRTPSPDVIRSVDAAVRWFEGARLADGRWARFYELRTNRPIFSGRDGIVRYRLEEIEQERRDGYAWLGTWPRDLIDKEYPKWKRGQQKSVHSKLQIPKNLR